MDEDEGLVDSRGTSCDDGGVVGADVEEEV